MLSRRDDGIMGIESYITEFIKITDFLIKSGKVKYEKGYVMVHKKILEQMLIKNNYDTVDNKLRIWKKLHWIDTDDNRFTKKVSMDGKRVRVVKIDSEVFQTLALLLDE